MSEILKSYHIVYDVHCQFKNFFGKEIIVKGCYTEVQAKYKLGGYCEKKYGREFESITFKSVTEEKEKKENNDKMFNDMFGDSNNFNNIFDTLINNPKRNKK